jgi:hypothetical protein
MELAFWAWKRAPSGQVLQEAFIIVGGRRIIRRGGGGGVVLNRLILGIEKAFEAGGNIQAMPKYEES